METARHVQHYRNPLKWGWYFVEGPHAPMTGLMSKRAAKRLMRDHRGEYGYGYQINYPASAPSNKLLRRLGFPLKKFSLA